MDNCYEWLFILFSYEVLIWQKWMELKSFRLSSIQDRIQVPPEFSAALAGSTLSRFKCWLLWLWKKLISCPDASIFLDFGNVWYCMLSLAKLQYEKNNMQNQKNVRLCTVYMYIFGRKIFERYWSIRTRNMLLSPPYW